MEFRAGGNGSGGGDQEGPNSRKGRKVYNRHTSQQIQRLESYDFNSIFFFHYFFSDDDIAVFIQLTRKFVPSAGFDS